MITNVAQVGSTEQGVAQGVNRHIGIAVTQQPQLVVNLHTANPQFAVGHQTVHIKAHSYSCHVVYICFNRFYLII